MSAADTASGTGVAVVIGGGPAGMLAAWALRGGVSRIVVVERDRYPDGPRLRAGIPQGHHAHLLLEAGHRGLDQLMPGIRAHLLSAGASLVRIGTELRWLGPFGWMADHDADTAILTCTRALLDHAILQRVRTDPTIEFREGSDVAALTGSPQAVDGVRIRDRHTHQIHTQPARLVVDASGRTTALPAWLEQLGCAPMIEQRLDPRVMYLSRLYHRPPDTDPGFGALYLQSRAPEHRWTGSLLPLSAPRICVRDFRANP